jgi:predicted TIM-barrel fold metal-dependent hydrolase
LFIRETLRAIGELELEQEVLDKLMHGNAERLLRLDHRIGACGCGE